MRLRFNRFFRGWLPFIAISLVSPVPPARALAPFSQSSSPAVLSDDEKEILSLLKARIPLHEETDPGAVKKIGESFRFCERDGGGFASFEEAISRIDEEYSKDFLRVYPAEADGKPAVGVNLLNEDGSIGHFVIKRRPAPQKKIRLPRNTEADQKESAKVVLEYGDWDMAVAPAGLDKGRLGALTDAEKIKRSLPVPLKRLELSRKQIREFLEKVPLDVERLLLDPMNDTTFEAFLKIYPQATVVFEEAFPEEFKNRKNFIPRILDPRDKKTHIVTLINRILQEIFFQRFGRPTDGIVDFSQFHAGESRGGATGPDTVNFLLQQLVLALEKVKIDLRRPLEEVRFKKPPVQAFAEWLKDCREKPLAFEVAGENDPEGWRLSDGVLIFDVDMTLLNKGEDFSKTKTEVYYTLIRLLELGIPLRIISGNAAREQYARILAPFEEYFSKRRHSPLVNVEMFTSTGSVRIHFDETGRRFVRDEVYDIKSLLGQDETGSGTTDRQDIENLALQAESDLRHLTQKLTAENGFNTDGKGMELLGDPRNFCRVQNNFGEEAPTNVPPVYCELRDGRSLTVKGEGLLSKDDKKRKAVLLSKEGLDWLEREYPGFTLDRFRAVSYRETILKWMRHLGSHGTAAQRRA